MLALCVLLELALLVSSHLVVPIDVAVLTHSGRIKNLMAAVPGLFASPVPVVAVVAEPFRVMLLIRVLAFVHLFTELIMDYILFLRSGCSS